MPAILGSAAALASMAASMSKFGSVTSRPGTPAPNTEIATRSEISPNKANYQLKPITEIKLRSEVCFDNWLTLET